MRSFFILFFSLHFSLFTFGQCINVFPFLEDFETTNGNWVSGGTGDDWTWGAISKPVIAQAAGGSNCWVTGGLTNSFYNFGERSYVQSPCFDFTTLQNPVVSFFVYWESEKTYDGAAFQYSLNGGTTWINVGTANEPVDCMNQNWYNTSSVTNLSGISNPKDGWSGNQQATQGSCQGGNGSSGWKLAKHCLTGLGGNANVVFRFVFGAGTQCNDYDGFAFDEFAISEASTATVDFTYTCTGGAYLFTGTSNLCPQTYTWNFGDGTQANTNNPTHTYATAGAYNVQFTAGGSCYNSGTITKPVNILSVNTSSIAVLCNGDNTGAAIATPAGGSNYTYQWNTNPVQTTDTAFNLTAGNYMVTVSAPGFCDAVATIVVNEPQVIALSFLIDADTCNTGVGKITTTASGGTAPVSNYLWSTIGVGSNVLSNSAEGNYSVTVSDVNACSVSAQVFVPYASPVVLQLAKQNVSCYGNSDGKIIVTPTGGTLPYIYNWSNAANTALLNHLDAGNYLLTVTDANNCSANDSVIIEKEVCPSYIYFPTAFSPNGDGVNDFFKPKYSVDLKKYFIHVYNRWGEMVYESADVNEGWNGIYKDVAQPLSTYVWYAEYSFADEKKHTKTGNITMVK